MKKNRWHVDCEPATYYWWRWNHWKGGSRLEEEKGEKPPKIRKLLFKIPKSKEVEPQRKVEK